MTMTSLEPAEQAPQSAMGSGNLLHTMELREFLLGLGVVMRLPRPLPRPADADCRST